MDVSSRDITAQLSQQQIGGNCTRFINGGVYLKMAHQSPAETSPSTHVVSISGKAKLGHHQVGEAQRHESIDFGQLV